jgi:FAD synthase
MSALMLGGFNAVHLGHGYIHQDHIRAKLPGEFDYLLVIDDFYSNQYARLTANRAH